MEFRILGPLEITAGARRLELGGSRPQITVATLLLNANRIVATDRLLEALYGESLPATCRSQLQFAVSALRRVFSTSGHPHLIDTHPNGYCLRIDESLLDARRFEELLVAARTATSPEEAIASYRDAQRMWRGPALQGLDSMTLRIAANRLDELSVTAAEERLQLELGLGRHHEVVGELAELVAGHPLRERLRGQLMLALHNCGRTAEALQTYQQARHIMAEEFGLAPGEELQRLHCSVLRSDPALTIPNAVNANRSLAQQPGAATRIAAQRYPGLRWAVRLDF